MEALKSRFEEQSGLSKIQSVLEFIELSASAQDYKSIFEGQMLIGSEYYILSNFDSSINYFDKALNTLDRLNTDQETMQSLRQYAYVKISEPYADKFQFKEALEYLAKAENIILEKENLQNKSLIYKNLIHIYLSTQAYTDALQYSDKALTIALQIKDTPLIANAYYEKAKALRYLQDYSNASLYFDSCNHFFRIVQNDRGLTHGSMEHALLNIQIKNFPQALLNLEVAKSAAGRRNDSITLANTLIFEALVHMSAKDNAAADNSFQKGLEMLHNHHANIYHLIAAYAKGYVIYDSLQDYKKALEYHKVFYDLNDSAIGLQVRKDLEDMNLKYKTAEKDNLLYAKELEIQKNKMEKLESDRQLQISKLKFEYEKKQAAAKTEQERKLLLMEEKNKRQKIENEYRHQQSLIQLEFEQRQNLIKANSEKEISEQKLALSQRKQWIYGLSALALLLLITALFLIWRYLSKKRTATELSEKNKRIETLIRELHHRVKNNMQVISSLLSLQSEKLDDITSKSALHEGINRVQAMGLIHQKLYLNEDLTVINMKQYIESLLENLLKSYYANPEKIQVEKKLSDLNLDIDTAVPLGLILNELLTNVFKHGMTHASPRLHVEYNGNQLIIKDNGIKQFDQDSLQKSDSFGMKLVQLLIRQINGTMEIHQDNGTTFELTFLNKTA